VVASASNRPTIIAILQQLGLSCSEVDDPYAAALELARRPMVYRALILSLASLFKEELSIIATIKRRMPQVEIWLTHTEGRVAALAEAMRQGADGLLSEEGLHRTAVGAVAEPLGPSREGSEQQLAGGAHEATVDDLDLPEPHEPVLTADELRALLHEQPDDPVA
jgi:hypothetical protein